MPKPGAHSQRQLSALELADRERELNECTQALYGCSHAELFDQVYAYGFDQGYEQGDRGGYARAKRHKPHKKTRPPPVVPKEERGLLIHDVDQRRALGQTPKEAVKRYLETMQVGKRAHAMHAEQAAKVVLDCLRAEQAEEAALDFSQAMEAGKDVFDLLRAMEASKDARILRAMQKAKRLLAAVKLPEQIVPKYIPDADVDEALRAYY
jgi:hypothetical protein